MIPDSMTAYRVHQLESRDHERAARTHRREPGLDTRRTLLRIGRHEVARLGYRRGLSVAAATGVIVVTAIGLLA